MITVYCHYISISIYLYTLYNITIQQLEMILQYDGGNIYRYGKITTQCKSMKKPIGINRAEKDNA